MTRTRASVLTIRLAAPSVAFKQVDAAAREPRLQRGSRPRAAPGIANPQAFSLPMYRRDTPNGLEHRAHLRQSAAESPHVNRSVWPQPNTCWRPVSVWIAGDHRLVEGHPQARPLRN